MKKILALVSLFLAFNASVIAQQAADGLTTFKGEYAFSNNKHHVFNKTDFDGKVVGGSQIGKDEKVLAFLKENQKKPFVFKVKGNQKEHGGKQVLIISSIVEIYQGADEASLVKVYPVDATAAPAPATAAPAPAPAAPAPAPSEEPAK